MYSRLNASRASTDLFPFAWSRLKLVRRLFSAPTRCRPFDQPVYASLFNSWSWEKGARRGLGGSHEKSRHESPLSSHEGRVATQHERSLYTFYRRVSAFLLLQLPESEVDTKALKFISQSPRVQHGLRNRSILDSRRGSFLISSRSLFRPTS